MWRCDRNTDTTIGGQQVLESQNAYELPKNNVDKHAQPNDGIFLQTTADKGAKKIKFATSYEAENLSEAGSPDTKGIEETAQTADQEQ